MSERDRFDDETWRTLVEAPLLVGMAVFSVSHPSTFGAFKELWAARSAAAHPGGGGAAPALLIEMSEAAGSDSVQHDLEAKSGSLPEEAKWARALEGIAAAGRAIGQLPADEGEAIIEYLLGVGQAVAEAAPDRGEKQKVSDAEAAAIATIERTLRGDP